MDHTGKASSATAASATAASATPAKTTSFDAADSAIQPERILRDLVRLIECPSVNPFDEPASAVAREHEVAHLYGEMLSNVGLKVTYQEIVPGRPNVWATLPTRLHGAPTILFAGHIDTVGVDGYSEPFRATLHNDRVYGRGSCDMKAALAAYIEVARIMQIPEYRDLFPVNIVIAGICDEEHGMLGSQKAPAAGFTPDMAIIGEPTELAVCPSHRGQVCLPITTFGVAVHSSRPELGSNAIVAMTEVLRAITMYADDLRNGPSHELCGVGTTNPGVIRGGTIASTVPDTCALEIDRRTLPGQDLALVETELRERLDRLRFDGEPLRYEIGAPSINAGPLDTPIEHPLVQHLLRAYEYVRGTPTSPVAFPAATDGPNLGVPTVICGPGSLTQAHTLNEYVAVADVVDATRMYLKVLSSFAPILDLGT